MEARLHPGELEQLRRLSTCVVASAIESFGVRLPNVGFTDASVRCMFPERPTVIGYAVTAKIKSATPPMGGRTYYYWRTDWWKEILTVPAPRIVVAEDEDHPAGLGAFVGEVHANILKAFGCAALVTNGALRDVPAVRDSGLQVFAGNISVSHAYAHISSFGQPVEVGRLKVHPGDLLLGDLHGVVSIPLEIASRVLPVAEGILRRRQQVIGMCRCADFGLETLRAAEQEVKAMEAQEQERIHHNAGKREGS